MPFNVIMFGLDSLSRNAWIRKLPKTYEFMTKVLDADILQGYNIIGDGTPQALIPVFSINRKTFMFSCVFVLNVFYFKAFNRLH